MTKIPHTDYYDSVILNEVRNGGIKEGIEWMRKRVIDTLLRYPDINGKCEYFAELVEKININDYFIKKS